MTKLTDQKLAYQQIVKERKETRKHVCNQLLKKFDFHGYKNKSNLSIRDISKEAFGPAKRTDYDSPGEYLNKVYHFLSLGTPMERNNFINKESRSTGSFLTVSDFAFLLLQTLNRAMIQSYEVLRDRQSYIDWVTPMRVVNFKDVNRPQLSTAGEVHEILPGQDAPINELAIGHDYAPDRYQTYRLKTYSRILSINKQAFMSDSQGDFQKVFTSPTAVIEKQATLVFNELVQGKITKIAKDGSITENDLYSSAHNNDSTAGDLKSAIQNLTTGLRRQKGFGGSQPLGMSLGYLVVPAKHENEAHELRYRYFGENFEQGFKVCVEPRLDDVNDDVVYGVAKEVDQVPFLDVASINDAPVMQQYASFSNDVLHWKLTHDMAAKVLNYESVQRCTITTS